MTDACYSINKKTQHPRASQPKTTPNTAPILDFPNHEILKGTAHDNPSPSSGRTQIWFREANQNLTPTPIFNALNSRTNDHNS